MNVHQLWVIIGFGILITLVLLIILWKRGGTIGTKQVSIFIPEAKKGNTPLGLSLQYLYDALPLIREEYEGAYLNLAKNSGIKEQDLMSNEDVKYFIQTAGNFVYSGNGINSIKTILEQVLSSKEWPKEKEEYDEFCGMIIRRIGQTVTKYHNNNYDDYVKRSEDGSLRQRAVNSIKIYEKLNSLYRNYDVNNKMTNGTIAEIIVQIIDHAVYLEGKKK